MNSAAGKPCHGAREYHRQRSAECEDGHAPFPMRDYAHDPASARAEKRETDRGSNESRSQDCPEETMH
jgi:hypothetical protein